MFVLCTGDTMSDFLKQIKEDILEYQSKYPHCQNMKKMNGHLISGF